MQPSPIQLKLEFLIPPQPSTGPTPSSPAPSCPAATADWDQLDEAARSAALGLLARLIARMLAQAPAKETGHE